MTDTADRTEELPAVTDPFEVPAADTPQERPTRLTAEQMRERTPEYPYGRRADGTPRSKPGVKGSGAAPRVAAAPGPRKSARPAAPKRAERDFRPGIMGLLQIPAMGLTMFGRQAKKPEIQADGMALAMHAGNIAEALNETARQQPAVARALESMMKAGPYGAILAAGVPLVMQIMANHRLMQPNPAMGIHAPEELVAASDADMASMAS